MRRFIDYGRARVSGGHFWSMLLRAAAANGVLRIAGMVASFAVGVQLARGLGVEGYGYYSLALAVITLAGIPSELGMPILVTREVAAASTRRDYSELFGVIRWAKRMSVRTSLAVAAILGCAAIVIGRFYSPMVGHCLLLGLPVIPLAALTRVRAGAIQGLNKVALAYVPEGLVRPLLLAAVLGLAFALQVKLDAPSAMALYSLTAAVMLFMASRLLTNSLPKDAGAQGPVSKRSLATSLPMGLMDAMRVVQGEVSIALAGITAAPAVVGLLRISNVTALTAAAPLIILTQVAMPLMASQFAEKNHERLQKTVTLVAQGQFLGLLLLGLPLLLFPSELLSLAFGSSFEAAAWPLRILVLAQIANAAFGPNIWLLNMTHHERRVLRALSIALVINVVTVPLLAKFYGATGAALGLFVSMLAWNIISWRDARRLVGIETSAFHWPWRMEARRA